MKKRMMECPGITIDPDSIAEGLLEMFDEDERTVLRFGMLPAAKMEALQRILEAKFREDFPNSGTSDRLVAVMQVPGLPRHHEFSMKKLVAEAVREVSLALYKIGDLVV